MTLCRRCAVGEIVMRRQNRQADERPGAREIPAMTDPGCH